LEQQEKKMKENVEKDVPFYNDAKVIGDLGS